MAKTAQVGSETEQSVTRDMSSRSTARFDVTMLAAVVLGLLLFRPLFAHGFPNTADGMLHLYRSALWTDAWQNGEFWPRWHTALYQGYGYPLFNFYAPLLYLAGGAFDLVAPSSAVALKAALLITCIAYPLGMYLWVRDLFGRWPAIVAAAAWTFASWRFRELFVQGNYAQFLAWALYPWVLFTWRRLAVRPSRGAFAAAVAALTALLLAHNISAMLFAPFAAVYVAWQAFEHRQSHPLPRLIAAAACAVAISLVFWLPALMERQYVQVNVLTQGYFDVVEHFITVGEQLAVTPPLDSRAANPILPFNFGRLHLALALVGSLLLFRPTLAREKRSHVLFALLCAALAAFLMVRESLPVWRNVPLIDFAEFPVRLYGVAFVWTSLLAGASVAWLDGKPRIQAISAILAVFALVVVVANLQFPRPFGPVVASAAGLAGYEADFRAPGTTSASEYLSLWTSSLPDNSALTKRGVRSALVDPPQGMTATVQDVTPTSLQLQVSAEAAGVAPVAQFYFPGWTAAIDGLAAELHPCTPAGLICVNLPAGDSVLTLTYAGTSVQRAAWLAAILGLLGVLLYMAFGFRASAANIPLVEPDEALPGAPWAMLAMEGVLLAAAALWIGPHTQLFRMESPPGVALPAEHKADLAMGDSVRLIGWDMAQDTVRQGDKLRVRLYWQAETRLEQDFNSFVQLIGGPDQRKYASSTAMHPGNVPSTSWNSNFYILDEHDVTIDADTPPALYTLRVGLSPQDSQERIGEADLSPQVRVVADPPVQVSRTAQRVDADFADGIQLLGVDKQLGEDELVLTLYWRNSDEPGANPQIFVHLLDRNGNQVAQADGAAHNGLYPVRDWIPGEIIMDVRTIPLQDDVTASTAEVGLYDLATLERVPVVDADGKPWPDNSVVLSLANDGEN